MRRPDVVLVRTFGIAAFASVPIVWLVGGQDFAIVAFEVLLGLGIAAPMASRMLGFILPSLVATTGLLLAGAAIFAGYTWAIARVDPSFQPSVAACAIGVTLVTFTTGQSALRRAAMRLLLGRREREMQELQQFIHTLSPDLGVMECSRRALAEIVRVRRLPGAALLFVDGSRIVCGSFDVEPLAKAWPRGADAEALPHGPYGSSEQRDLPRALRDAILEANVGFGVASIDSPRRRWGHLFLRTGYLGGILREDDADAFASFLDQFALLLDAADLLARTVAVERSLAHAEKLATIGELAARVRARHPEPGHGRRAASRSSSRATRPRPRTPSTRASSSRSSSGWNARCGTSSASARREEYQLAPARPRPTRPDDARPPRAPPGSRRGPHRVHGASRRDRPRRSREARSRDREPRREMRSTRGPIGQTVT
jgi:hypothetical protein